MNHVDDFNIFRTNVCFQSSNTLPVASQSGVAVNASPRTLISCIHLYEAEPMPIPRDNIQTTLLVAKA